MKLKSLFCIGMAAISMCSCNNGGGQKMTHIPNQLRAPMYPLVTIDHILVLGLLLINYLIVR